MKKLLILLILLPTFCNSQTLQGYSGRYFKAIEYFNSPIYKLSGVDLDSANTVKKGFFTKFQYNKLQSAKQKNDSVLNSGFATNYKLNQKVSSQWTTSSSNIYFNSGNVYIGKTSGTYKLDVNGTIGGSNFETNTTSRSLRAGIGAGNSENETTTRYNVYLGYAAGYTNSTGDQNVYIGSNAGYSGGGKTQSTIIGYNSGYNLTGNHNTFLGTNSGYTATNSDNCIFIGDRAGYYLNKSNSFIINSISRSNATQDTTYSIIYGLQNTDPTLQRLRINGNLGVNISPTTSLEISGGAKFNLTKDFYLYSVTDECYPLLYDYSSNIMFFDPVNVGMYVGIGTYNPQAKLSVNGGVQVGSDGNSATSANVGTIRYRTSGNNSYCEMCMQTGASTYAWVVIKTNSW